MAGPEITPRRRALLVTLLHGLPQIGVAPVPLRTIQSMLGVPKSTCSNIYKHALKNATLNRYSKRDCAAEDADVFLAGIQAQLDKIYTEPRLGECPTGSLEEEEQAEHKEEIPLLDLISMDCLNPDARSGRSQALSEAEKDHLIATAKRDWGTRHMTLTEIQKEAGLGHVDYATVLRALHSRGIKAYVEECKFILNEDNKKRCMVSGYYCDS